jgi:hypothetical protein
MLYSILTCVLCVRVKFGTGARNTGNDDIELRRLKINHVKINRTEQGRERDWFLHEAKIRSMRLSTQALRRPYGRFTIAYLTFFFRRYLLNIGQ